MKRHSLASVVAAGTLTCGVVAYAAVSRASAPPVVARVNETTIVARDLDARVAEILPMFAFHASMPPERMRSLRRAALDELLLDELIVQDARAQGVRPDPAEVEKELAGIRQRFASAEEFEAALTSAQLSERDLRAQLSRAVEVRAARKAHLPADPTDADVRAYFDANPGKLLRPEQARVVELLVRVDPAGGAAAGAAGEKKARSLAARARGGEDLGALAREHSDDDWRVKDGDLGWVHRGRLDPDLEAAAFAVPIGEVRIARSLSGFHVFRVLERRPEAQLGFDEARPIIADRLRRQRQESAEAEWYARLRRDARVEILDTELRNATPLELPHLGLDPRRPGSGGGMAIR